MGLADFTTGCEAGLGALFEVEFSVPYEPLAARHTSVNRTSSSLLVLLPEEFKQLLSTS
jgi:hypothetical protein